MSNSAFGSDPMDVYSKSPGLTNTKFGQIFKMQVRENPDKPGRSVAVVWDERISLIKDFQNRYSYLVTFSGIGKIAGNHYHKYKH